MNFGQAILKFLILCILFQIATELLYKLRSVQATGARYKGRGRVVRTWHEADRPSARCSWQPGRVACTDLNLFYSIPYKQQLIYLCLPFTFRSGQYFHGSPEVSEWFAWYLTTKTGNLRHWWGFDKWIDKNTMVLIQGWFLFPLSTAMVRFTKNILESTP